MRPKLIFNTSNSKEQFSYHIAKYTNITRFTDAFTDLSYWSAWGKWAWFGKTGNAK